MTEKEALKKIASCERLRAQLGIIDGHPDKALTQLARDEDDHVAGFFLRRARSGEEFVATSMLAIASVCAASGYPQEVVQSLVASVIKEGYGKLPDVCKNHEDKCRQNKQGRTFQASHGTSLTPVINGRKAVPLCVCVFEFLKRYLPTTDTNYLEIGVYNGGSIRELGQIFVGRAAPTVDGKRVYSLSKAGCPARKTIFAIDPFIEDGNTTHCSNVYMGEKLKSQRKNTMDGIVGLSNVKLFEMTSEHFYKNLTKEMITEMNVGTVFIDGSHRYKDVVNDYQLALDLIGNKNGIICFDDLQEDDVDRACNEFTLKCKDRIIDRVYLNQASSIFYLKQV